MGLGGNAARVARLAELFARPRRPVVFTGVRERVGA
jgi:hypothetical protein